MHHPVGYMIQSAKNIFRWIFTYLYFAFDNVFFKNKKRGKYF